MNPKDDDEDAKKPSIQPIGETLDSSGSSNPDWNPRPSPRHVIPRKRKPNGTTMAHGNQNPDRQKEKKVHRHKSPNRPKVEAKKVNVESSDEVWKACHFEKLPPWMRDNNYLIFGYRPELKTFQRCFHSIIRVHTETGNIWTHLIGSVMFLVITIMFYTTPFCHDCKNDMPFMDKLIFLVFLLGAMTCFSCSMLFHTVSCHSPRVSNLFSRVDYCGIAVMIVASVIPVLYFGFYCQFYTRLVYSTIIGGLGVVTIVVIMWDKFNQPAYRSLRASIFVSLGCLSALPVVHLIILFGLKQAILQASLQNMMLMGAMYLTGAMLYASRIPERFVPGRVDIWFQSHQIFHILGVMAAFVHFHGLEEMALYRIHTNHVCPDPNY